VEEGFIVSNKMRKAIFTEVASGETSLARIIKKHHLIEQAARTAAEELQQHALIEDVEGALQLTELGVKTYGKLKARDSL